MNVAEVTSPSRPAGARTRLWRWRARSSYETGVLVAALGVLAATAATWSLGGVGGIRRDSAVFAGLSLAAALAPGARRGSRRHGQGIGAESAFSFALLLSVGPASAALSYAGAAALGGLVAREQWSQISLRASRAALAMGAAAATLMLLNRPPQVVSSGGTVLVGSDMPKVIAAACVFLGTAALVNAWAHARAGRGSLLRSLRSEATRVVLTEPLLLAFSPILVLAAGEGLFFVVLLVLPIVGIAHGAEIAADRHRAEERFRSLVHHTADAMSIVDRDGIVRYQSSSTEAVLGYRPDDLLGRHILEWVHADDVGRLTTLVDDLVGTPGAKFRSEFRCRSSDGAWRHFEAIFTNLLDDPRIGGIVVNARDITTRKALEDRLAHQAFHDPLTGLANRALFENRVAHALARSMRSDASVAVLFLDLDDFKPINDSLGHDAGDELLMAVARRLGSCVRPGDTIARVGGDEFAVMLEGRAGRDEVVAVAERVLVALDAPFTTRGREVFVGASIGIASGLAAGDQDDMLRNADVAMYLAKADGKGRYVMFEPAMRAAVIDRLELAGDLQRAIERSQLALDYQPIVALEGGAIVGVEALVRWLHPDRGLVTPAGFIPLAEETGVIPNIGRWVLHEACRRAVEWRTESPVHDLAISVNLSAHQVPRADLLEDVDYVLRRTGLPPDALILEITESAMMRDFDEAERRLRALKDLGIRLALDDFGTGYSSLSYLSRLPIDILKIDKSFIQGIQGGSEDSALARAIIKIGRSLRLTTIAEGIERPEQVEGLVAMRCELGQGRYLVPPLDAQGIGALLREGVGVPATPGEARVIPLPAGTAATRPSGVAVPEA